MNVYQISQSVSKYLLDLCIRVFMKTIAVCSPISIKSGHVCATVILEVNFCFRKFGFDTVP